MSCNKLLPFVKEAHSSLRERERDAKLLLLTNSLACLVFVAASVVIVSAIIVVVVVFAAFIDKIE